MGARLLLLVFVLCVLGSEVAGAVPEFLQRASDAVMRDWPDTSLFGQLNMALFVVHGLIKRGHGVAYNPP